jgi:hypothetical protein
LEIDPGVRADAIERSGGKSNERSAGAGSAA